MGFDGPLRDIGEDRVCSAKARDSHFAEKHRNLAEDVPATGNKRDRGDWD
jgi:hypothetical protein